jgi:AraC family transcriptional regulator of adaptative response / DNA-3-methyladenine glycosylase II
VHAAFGDRLDGSERVDRLPATAAALAAVDPDELSRIGMPRSRARTLVLLAQSVERGDVTFTPSADIDGVIAALQRVPGIGPWTAEYIAMRGHQWPDAFPATDLGVRTALRGHDVNEVSDAWRPWRAYAAIHLWNSLSADTNGR